MRITSSESVEAETLTQPEIGRPVVSRMALSRLAAIFEAWPQKKDFLAFRVSPALKDEIQGIAADEARSISQICELLLIEGVEAHKKEGSKFMQRLVAKQKAADKVKGSCGIGPGTDLRFRADREPRWCMNAGHPPASR